MDKRTYFGCLLLFTVGGIQRCATNVEIGLTIHDFYNPKGTAYEDTSSNRTCCDGPRRESCDVGDLCDTYFDICIGIITGMWKCNGATLVTAPRNNTNNITDVQELRGSSTSWDKEMAIFVSIRDDDTNGTHKAHNDIDRLIEVLRFQPQAQELLAHVHDYEWQGKTTLSLSLRAWCSQNYFGDTCSTYCFGIQPIALCERPTGQLICQFSDELLLEFKKYTPQSQYPDIDRNIHSFVANEVCDAPNNTQVLYPRLDSNSNTLSFTAFCQGRQISAMEFESILLLKSDSTLTSYFPTSIHRGMKAIPKGYGQHITPNVYFGIEIADMEHPTGTSYYGSNMPGDRRCCDVNKTLNCDTEADTCDMSFSICIGSLVEEDECVGAFVKTPVYLDSTSLYTCGPALLDYSTRVAHPQHPMIGAMRLTENATMIQVTVIDSDNEGTSFDVVDILAADFIVKPDANVTVATSHTLALKNIVTLKLKIIAWCAPGHSGPLCDPDNGTDSCFPGWYGDDCEMHLNPCISNPCQHEGMCNHGVGTFNCTCAAGYTGRTCTDDVNECQLGVCQNGAICNNKIGEYFCNCTQGWSGKICTENVTQCNPSPCLHGGMCTPTVNGSVSGNHVCACGAGWHGGNCELPVNCIQNECIHGICGVYEGYHRCQCYEGFKGYNCTEDIDECLDAPCKHGGSCVNTLGAFSCYCLPGYTGLTCDSVLVCDSFSCKNNGTCIKQEDGQLTCMCPVGFTGNQCEQRIDYCERVICENNSTCTSKFGDFQCNCPASWSGKTCDVDVNECKKNICRNTNRCSNLPGSYHCDCLPGWQGQNCDQDINECQQRGTCVHGTCTNTNGSYTCSCMNNYSGRNCSQIINICRSVNCSGHGKCLESSGQCKCDPEWNGNACQYDVDECYLEICGPHSFNCHNTQGSYTCSCSSGWSGTTSNCNTDVNECLSNNCSRNGVCRNTVGSYTCQCFKGFTGTNCETFVNLCATVSCQNGGSCHVTENGTQCMCQTGWSGNNCETDVNECLSSPCVHNGSCTNIAGSFTCSCTANWYGGTCQQDTNECLNGVCNHGICMNTAGGYKCTCSTGWQGSACEVKTWSNMTGSLFEIKFTENVTVGFKQDIISSLYRCIHEYVCNNSVTQLYIKKVIGSIVQFKARCQGHDLTMKTIKDGMDNVPGHRMSNLFGLTFTGIRKAAEHEPPGVQSPNTPWVNNHWWVIVVTCGCAVAIAVAIVIIVIRRKRSSKREAEGFNNIAFTMTEYI